MNADTISKYMFLNDRLPCVRAILDADLTDAEKSIAHIFNLIGKTDEEREYHYKLGKARMAQDNYVSSKVGKIT